MNAAKAKRPSLARIVALFQSIATTVNREAQDTGHFSHWYANATPQVVTFTASCDVLVSDAQFLLDYLRRYHAGFFAFKGLKPGIVFDTQAKKVHVQLVLRYEFRSR